MSGDQRNDDDPDFLDDEFVVEGLSDHEPQDDLDQLLALPPQPVAEAPTPAPADDAAAEELFADHSAGLQPSESFGADQPQFAENAPSTWNGNELELDDPSTTPASLTPPVDADEPPTEFALDGESTWADGEEQQGEEAYADEADASSPGDFLGIAAEAPQEPVDEFADEPAADEAESYAELDETLADEAMAPVLAGPAPAGARWGVVFASAAATLALVAGAAVVVLRPQWVGIPGQHAQAVAIAKVERPHVEVELLPPAMVAVATPPVAPVVEPTVTTPAPVAVGTPAPTSPDAEPESVPMTAIRAVAEPIATAKPEPAPVVAQATTPTPTTTPITTPAAATTPTPSPAPATTPVAVASAPVVAWPVARGSETAKASGARKPVGSLVRVGDDTMLGEADADAGERRVVDGVIPGVKAFAQLRNGNFFIGSVKSVDAGQVTLRTSEGEVTLGKAELTRLTGLGSSDYEALQKATDGFVRLTNSNKLVGGILSQIADDHVVLEFRSNRVILPRSAVGEVVAGPQGEGVRLGTTTEENDWVRKLAEREVGAKPAEAKAPTKADGK